MQNNCISNSNCIDGRKKMNILIICDLFPPDVVGGYELRCEEAANWLNNHGYHVEVLTTKFNGPIKAHPYVVNRLLEKYPLGQTPFSWSYLKKLYFAIKDNLILKKVIAKFKPDLVYIWNLTGISRTLIPLIFSSKERKLVDVSSTWLKKVYEQHGPIYGPLHDFHNNKIKSLLKALLKNLLPVISLNTILSTYKLEFNNLSGYFTSKWNRQLHAQFLASCNNFKVIYTGIDTDIFPFYGKDWNPSRVNFLYIGRIQEEKGFLLLLEQLKFIRDCSDLPIHLTVVGKFDNQKKEKEIREQISKLGIETLIDFEGQVQRSELSHYYHEADFAVFPSLTKEAFSRIPLESMACGTPCISTDNPGSKELFDLQAPLILLKRTKEGLRESIQPFIDDKQKYFNVARNGKKYVDDYFTFEHFMKKVQNNFLLEE